MRGGGEPKPPSIRPVPIFLNLGMSGSQTLRKQPAEAKTAHEASRAPTVELSPGRSSRWRRRPVRPIVGGPNCRPLRSRPRRTRPGRGARRGELMYEEFYGNFSFTPKAGRPFPIGRLLSLDDDLGARFATHEYLKRDGGELEPMGGQQGRYSFRIVPDGIGPYGRRASLGGRPLPEARPGPAGDPLASSPTPVWVESRRGSRS